MTISATQIKNPSKRLRVLYILGLTLIGILTVLGQLLIRSTLSDQSADARVINIAGRQRMLSQKIAKTAMYLQAAQTTEEFNQIQQQFKGIVALWEKAHRALQEGNETMNIPKAYNSAAIVSKFTAIQPHFDAIYAASHQLSSSNFQTVNTTIKSELQAIIKHEPDFLKLMNEITFQYAAEANEKIERLKQIELILLLVTILVLIIEAVVIFRPAVKNIDKYFILINEKNEELAEKNKLAQQYSEEVMAQNEELQQQSEELMATNNNLKEVQTQLEESLGEQESLNEELQQNAEEMMQINEHLSQSQKALEATIVDKAAVNDELLHQKQALEEAMKKLKEAQMHLVQSEKLSSLGQLTAGIAHEINNPINFVYAGADTLQQLFQEVSILFKKLDVLSPTMDQKQLTQQLHELDKLKKELHYHELQEDVDGLISDIILGAGRTKDIVTTLRTFTRLDENAVKPVDLHQNIDSTLVILRSEFINGIELIKEYQEDVPFIECKISQINQVFLNIINNAIQAIDGKGTLTIKTTVHHDTQMVSISISDTGQGMTEETMQKLYDPFFTTKPVGEGTGLGLSISMNIIQKHAGTIQVYSELGKGSTFVITLPIVQAQENLKNL